MGAAVGVVGCLQAAEVLKILLGLAGKEGSVLDIDALRGSTRRLRFDPREGCPSCRGRTSTAKVGSERRGQGA